MRRAQLVALERGLDVLVEHAVTVTVMMMVVVVVVLLLARVGRVQHGVLVLALERLVLLHVVGVHHHHVVAGRALAAHARLERFVLVVVVVVVLDLHMAIQVPDVLIECDLRVHHRHLLVVLHEFDLLARAERADDDAQVLGVEREVVELELLEEVALDLAILVDPVGELGRRGCHRLLLLLWQWFLQQLLMMCV